MRVTLAELVRQVAEAEGIDIDAADGPRQLADRLGLGGRNDVQTVRRWRDGENANPRFDRVLLLFERAGMLSKPTSKPAPAVSARREVGLSEHEIAQAIRQLADAVDAQTARLDELQPREAGRAQTRSRKAAQGKKRTA